LRRLALKLPTALQINPNRALLFYEKGVKEFTELNAPAYNPLGPMADPLGRIWALVDCMEGLHEPAPVFKNGPFFVVETTSPCPAGLRWTRNVRSNHFYMKLWSFVEVLQA
jgi:hypothetical protein